MDLVECLHCGGLFRMEKIEDHEYVCKFKKTEVKVKEEVKEEDTYTKVVAIVGEMYPRNVMEAVIKHTKDMEEAIQTLLDGIHEQTWLDKDKPQINPAVKEVADITGRTDYDQIEIELKKHDGNIEAVVSSMLGLSKGKKKKYECPICLDDFPVEELYTVDCSKDHRFCFDCFKMHVTTSLEEMQEPNCPGCKDAYLLKPEEITNVFADTKYTLKLNELQLRKGLENLGAIGCPTPNCKGYVVPQKKNNVILRELVFCQNCRQTYCSACQTSPYHYRIPCHEVASLQSNWIWWMTTGRLQYGTDKKKQDEEFKKEIDKYRREMQKREKENKELTRRYDELMQDERWKSENCRVCPKCNRAVEKLSGCDSMICGGDYHGGNNQNGCGQQFHWSSAAKYVSNNDIPSALKDRDNLLKGLNEPDQKKVSHWPFQCSTCERDILGIRFSCINCPTFDICDECESFKLSAHDEKHIFKIIREGPEDHKK